MNMTIEVMNKKTINILRDMEGLGLLQIHPSKTIPEVTRSYRQFRGCCMSLPGGSVNEFLKNCRADKEREFAIEKRQTEESSRHA